MTILSRRSLLSFMPIAGAAFALPGIPLAAEPGPLMVEWEALSNLTKSMVVADYWRALDPEAKRVACQQLREKGLGHIADQLMPEFTGPGIYEFRVLDEEGGTTMQPVAYLDHAPRRPDWFRWQHIYRGKLQGRGHLLPANRIQITKKVEALG